MLFATIRHLCIAAVWFPSRGDDVRKYEVHPQVSEVLVPVHVVPDDLRPHVGEIFGANEIQAVPDQGKEWRAPTSTKSRSQTTCSRLHVLFVVTDAIKHLPPSAFAMVMGTGIVSIAFDGLGYGGIAQGLFAINLATYGVLVPMFGARMVLYRDAFLADVRDPERGWSFLTFVVGTNTLGSQLVLFQNSILGAEILGAPLLVAKGLWIVGVASWVAFMYLICARLVAHNHGPIESVVNGATLLVVVSTQSVAVLGSQLAEAFGALSDVMMLVALTYFAAGWVLYLIVITLVTYRLLLRPLEPGDWTGPYWICMGAAAITTLAGATMLLYLDVGDLYAAILVVTYLAWAVGVWWIPILLYLDIWKFTRLDVVGKRPIWISLFPWLRLAFGREGHHHYETPSWGRVFPMGMFTACTIALTQASDFDVLFAIPSVWGWFALVIWGLTFVGTVRSIGKTLAFRG